ncbi:thiol-disulfide oxidoreductase DCC family protein [Actinopolyspora mortivallis]|uniref:thiol-disulfide oxidoreductase DCC family protein n=1 Tax=Actinopolyspora mortivallis TaxID=33906 RepID=UPI000376E640|nr:DCC1-like thiol-disulfide oxidoreductase family protein [Actinopolyspora mortivallis]
MRDRPVLVYDGDCGFCTRSVRVVDRLPVRVNAVPWQEADLARLGVTERRVRHEVVLVEPFSGRVHGGAAAVAALLRHCRGPLRLLGGLLALPGVATVVEWVYRVVADNRHRLPGETPACRLPPERRPGQGGNHR